MNQYDQDARPRLNLVSDYFKQEQDRFSLKTIHAYITLPLSLPCPWLVWFVSFM